MLRMFGLGEGESSEIGWGHAELEGTDVNVNSMSSDLLWPRGLLIVPIL